MTTLKQVEKALKEVLLSKPKTKTKSLQRLRKTKSGD
jgi:hypothetical protein